VKSEARSWLPEAAGWAASCVWLLGTAGAAADAGELKRLLPDSMGKTPGVVDEVTEPIDEPMKEGISPAGASMVSVGGGMMLSKAVTPGPKTE